MPGVFISYRRGDGGWAGRLKDCLLLRFGDSLVWQDVDDIPLGANFPDKIQQAIKEADAVLIVIGPYWTTKGIKRLQNARDMVRMEIRRALMSRATVLPLLVGEANMPQSKELPPPIAKITKLDAARISDADWGRGIQILLERLQEIVHASGAGTPVAELHDQIGALEARYWQAYGKDDNQALKIARDALRLLDEQMPHYPCDNYLQMQRGYFLKNAAMSSRNMGDEDGFASSLVKSQQVFETMRVETKLYLASAYNGLGSVQMLRGQFKESLAWIDRALELEPDYPQALQDRKAALQYLRGKRTKRNQK